MAGFHPAAPARFCPPADTNSAGEFGDAPAWLSTLPNIDGINLKEALTPEQGHCRPVCGKLVFTSDAKA